MYRVAITSADDETSEVYASRLEAQCAVDGFALVDGLKVCYRGRDGGLIVDDLGRVRRLFSIERV